MATKILVYHLWPIAWGSIRLMAAFLYRIKALGADYVWLSPIQPSPRKNHGYDISDHFSIDERLGTMEDFDEFVRLAHILGLKVIMDLVVDSTSKEHIWFERNLSRYQSASENSYQANLDWFPGGVLNRVLLENFRMIMSYWLEEHDIDGFRIGSIEALSKNLGQSKLTNASRINQASVVVNELANTYGQKTPFLMMECADPDYGNGLERYSESTDVEYIANSKLKTIPISSIKDFQEKIGKMTKSHKFILELESYDTQKFTTRAGLTGKATLDLMFKSEASAVCLYQGQELGQYVVAPRLPIPLDEYYYQETHSSSVLSYAKTLIKDWKR